MEAANNNVTANAEDLDKLLDSCLEDFNKPLPKAVPNNPQASSSIPQDEVKATNSDELPDTLNWGEEFKQFRDVMENFLENEGELNDLKNLMGTLNESNPLNEGSFDQSLLDTIKGLTEETQNVPEMSPDELSGFFNDFGIDEAVRDDMKQLPELIPIMHNVMQKLMSKDLLYPSLKEIVDKYPDWLAENQPSLNPEEYEQYNQQFNLMKSVCEEFENENEDSEEAKKEKFERILALMQKVQNYGNPPKELVSDIGQSVPLDEHGNLQIPGMPQCSVM